MDYTTAKRTALNVISDYEVTKNTLNSQNFMTPEILKTFKVNKRYNIEVSLGTGFCNPYIYGVTVFKTGAFESEHDLSGCVTSGEELESFINNIKGE